MWLMLQQQSPEDYVIATGHTFSLEKFVATAFELLQLDWREHVMQDSKIFRPDDIFISSADPSKARIKLNWAAKLQGKAVVERMMNG